MTPGSGALLVPVGAGVGDGCRRLRGEQYEDLLVLLGEPAIAFLFAEKKCADMHAAMAHRRRLQGPREGELVREAERVHVAGQIVQAQRSREIAQMYEKLRSVRPVHQAAQLVRGEAGGDQVADLARLVDGRDQAVAGAGQRPGAVRDLLQDGGLVETRADPQDGRAQLGNAPARRRRFQRGLVEVIHAPILPGSFAQVYRTARGPPLADPARDASIREAARIWTELGQKTLNRHFSHVIIP